MSVDRHRPPQRRRQLLATAISVAGRRRSEAWTGQGQTAYVFTAVGRRRPLRSRSCC